MSTPARAPGTWTTVSLAAFATYATWAYVSIAWAGDRGIALVGANRTLLYLILFGVLATRRWRGTDVLALAAVWGLATIVVGCVTLMRVAHSAHPASFFVSGRLATPVDYANANAALFVLASWPFIVGMQDRRFPALLRAGAAALATVAAALAVLSQSKGAAIGVAATVIIVAAVIPNRGRFLVSVLLVGGVIAAFHAPLLHLYTQLNAEGDQRHAARVAALSVVGSAVVAGVLGLGVATLDRVVADRRPRSLRIASTVLVAAAAASVAAAAAGVVVHYGGPSKTLHRGWHAFTHPSGTSASSHFTSTTGNHRYDMWRVAAHQFRRAPLTGAGIDNFGADYVRERKTNEQPLYPHSLVARLLGGTGLIGFILFAIFAGVLLWRVASVARSRGPQAPAALAALAMLVYWLAHGSVDWLWEFPGLSGPTLAVAACAASFEAPHAWKLAKAGRRVLLTGAGIAAIAAAAILTTSWLAARDIAVALSNWRSDLPAAYADLRQASSLNRLSDEPYVVAGTLAERHKDWGLARQQFEQALGRNGDNWYSHLELGVALANQGDATGAHRELQQAHVLDPGESLITDSLAAVRDGRRVDARSLDQEIIARTPAGAAR
ncbi:MAG TPA: O-antigen ligase family protein [Gaiellaceae bacterium]|nr:O-antigen ligase family protein [Gaiellaceae bacterium]